jgi:molybdopterin-containing oxidoreductase family iron-sulfur binding subunit
VDKNENNESVIKKQFNRRQFIKIAGFAALGAAVGGTATKLGVLHNNVEAQVNTDTNAISLNQWVMVFDLRRCDGCGHCTDACSKMHYLSSGIEWIKVYELTGSLGQKYFLPRPCMQCENPPCLRVCPVHATYKTQDGVTLVDQNICIG